MIRLELSKVKVPRGIIPFGGACKNNFLMQFQSNIMQIDIDRPINIESTALGAGMLAGLGSGFWKNTKELINIQQILRLTYC